MTTERRPTPRRDLDVGYRATGRHGERITILDVAAGGCRIHAPRSFVETHDVGFRVRNRGGRVVRLTGRVVYVEPAASFFHESCLAGIQLDAEVRDRTRP